MVDGRRVVTALMLVAVLAGLAVAATRVVSDDAAVAAALKEAGPGDEIVLKAGQYKGEWRMPNGEDGKPVTLRAERAGRVFVGRLPVVEGFAKVAGTRYVWVADWTVWPAQLMEADTNATLRHVGSVVDCEDVVGSYYLDVDAGKLYLHATKSGDPRGHTVVSVQDITGLAVGSHCVVEGLAFTGFGGTAVSVARVQDVRIENCTFYYNGYGAHISECDGVVVRGCRLWMSRPLYSQGAQIHVSAKARNVLVEDCFLTESRATAIFGYAGNMDHITYRGNVADSWIAFKTQGTNLDLRNNASLHGAVGHNQNYGTNGNAQSFNTYAQKFNSLHESDLYLGNVREPRFADPAYFDMRLQSDSPALGKGPGGKDLGAHQYEGDVLYVAVHGDDANSGTTDRKPWKTFAHACGALKPGQTLYVMPGVYAEGIALKGLKSMPDNPVRIRAHGRGAVQVAGVSIEECAGVSVEHIRVLGAVADGFAVRDSRDVRLDHCLASDCAGAGVAVSGGGRGIVLDSLTLVGNTGAGLEASNSTDIELDSSLLTGNAKGQVALGEKVTYFGQFNAFGTPVATGSDTTSRVVALKGATPPVGSPIWTAGRYGRAIGALPRPAVAETKEAPDQAAKAAPERVEADEDTCLLLRFDAVDGDRIKDDSRAGDDAVKITQQALPELIEDGVFGKAARFNGKSALGLTKNISALSGARAATISMWLRYDSTKKHEMIVFSNFQFAVIVESNANGRIMKFHPDRKLAAVYMPLNDVDTSQWHHYTCVYDATAGKPRVRMFVDGQKRVDTTAGLLPKELQKMGQVLIGMWNYTGTKAYVGDIDELRVSTTARSLFNVADAGGKQNAGNDHYFTELKARTTATTADISWWTPHGMVGTAVAWGETPECKNVYDHAGENNGEYVARHTVGIIGLKPSTTYHYRVGFGDHAQPGNPIVWGSVKTFTTAATMPTPRRLYVSLKGNDANDGLGPETPWRTLRKACDEAAPGDTVTILPGTYQELLRPMRTGASEGERITFRAERPLTVFLDGGFRFQAGMTLRMGRPHCIETNGKAFVTFENLVTEKVAQHDFGGYRGGWGYGGNWRQSGGCAIEYKDCISDNRYRWSRGFVAFGGGDMPGAPEGLPAATFTDCVTLFGWAAAAGYVTRPVIFRNCVFYRSMTSCISIYVQDAPWVFKNCIFQELLRQKDGNALFPGGVQGIEADYNLYYANPKNPYYPDRLIAGRGKAMIKGLKEWREKSKQDLHSKMGDPIYPATRRLDCGKRADPKAKKDEPITFEDFIPAPDSPCRGAGENGEDIGVRWEKWLRK